eukprot:390891_1
MDGYSCTLSKKQAILLMDNWHRREQTIYCTCMVWIGYDVDDSEDMHSKQYEKTWTWILIINMNIDFVQVWVRHNITHCPSQSYRDVCQVISEYVECDTLKYCADIRDPVHKDQLRDLILKEIIYLNPQWKKKLMRKLHGCACF